MGGLTQSPYASYGAMLPPPQIPTTVGSGPQVPPVPPKQPSNPTSTRSEQKGAEISIKLQPDPTTGTPKLPTVPNPGLTKNVAPPAQRPMGPQGAPATPPVDPYVQSQQAAIAAEQDLLKHPTPDVQYKPPNKWAMLGAMLLTVLGGPGTGSALGAGLTRGLEEGAQNRYTREQQAATTKETEQEKRAQVLGTIAEQQGSIQAREDAITEHRDALALHHGEVLDKLEQNERQFQQTYKLKNATLQADVTKWNGTLAEMAARNAITGQDAQLAANTRMQVAALQQSGLDRRFTSNLQFQSIVHQATALQAGLEGKIRALDASVAQDPSLADTVSAQASSLVSSTQSQIDGLMDRAGRLDPTLAAASSATVPSETLGNAPTTAPTQPPGTRAPAQAGSGQYSYFNDPLMGGANPQHAATQVGSRLQSDFNSALQTSGLGQGQGVPDATFNAAQQYVTKNAGTMGGTFGEFLAALGKSDSDAAQLSAPQVEALAQTWYAHHVQASPPTKPGATPAKPGTAPHAAPPAQHAARDPYAIPPSKQQAYDLLMQRRQQEDAISFNYDTADAAVRSELGIPVNPHPHTLDDAIQHFAQQSQANLKAGGGMAGEPRPAPPNPAIAQKAAQAQIARFHQAGIPAAVIQREFPDLIHAAKGQPAQAARPKPVAASGAHLTDEQTAQRLGTSGGAWSFPEGSKGAAVVQAALDTPGLGEQGIPLLMAVIHNESHGDPAARSGAGAIGMTQLMPGTAAGLGVDPNDPEQNIMGGARYLAMQLKRFGSIPLALAAYNAGPGAVIKYRGIPPYAQTQSYVKAVIGSYLQLRNGMAP